MRCFLSACVFLLLTNSASSQAVLRGKVTGQQGNILSGVIIYQLGKMANNTTSDADGIYKLNLASDTTLKCVVQLSGYLNDTLTLKLKKGEVREMRLELEQKTIELGTAVITDTRALETGMVPIDRRIITSITGPGGGIEMTIKTLPGVYSNNELSSQYSVRGGNYDENLVYVNDVEIYRPFLVRAGQQEGLSFPNPDMVENLRFSAGGFEAKYGDKMSSVLDIRYKRPKDFGGAVSASILGGNIQLEGSALDYRLSGMVGARYRTTQYLLNSLDVNGQYRPAFTDIQGFVTYSISDRLDFDLLGNYAVNNYRVFPQDQKTEFGTINQALQLRVFFEGKEQNRFATGMGAATLHFRPDKNTSLKLIASSFNSSESERSDVEGFYFIDELERDLGSEDFGDVAFNRGIGSFLTFIRNRLDYQVSNIEHKGSRASDNHFLSWGIRAQNERIQDELKEWKMIDSAGYSLPVGHTYALEVPENEAIILDSYLKSDTVLNSYRYHAYLQDEVRWKHDSVQYSITAGIRANHWTLNGQTLLSPRMVFSMRPLFWKREITFRAAAGHYAQPPFYRELRGFDGQVKTGVKAQESWHFITGAEFTFKSWGRDFSFYSEAYYKILRNLVPYEIDNVRVRYYAANLSDGYAAGLDMKVNGEFVKGVQSWASMSFMQTKEDIRNDFYYDYFNASGDKIIKGYSSEPIADSVRVEPGFIPRPTDQRLNFSLFFQDYLPRNESLSMQITLIYGSRLPMGPPDLNRYRDTLRIPPYRRVDIGFTKHFISANRPYKKDNWLKNVKALSLSLEVFNLLGVNNTVSYLWIKDVTNRLYGVPNYLTNRLLNLRLQASF
jgi:hypothetical protein